MRYVLLITVYSIIAVKIYAINDAIRKHYFEERSSVICFYCLNNQDPHCSLINQYLMHLAKEDIRSIEELESIKKRIKKLENKKNSDVTNFIGKRLDVIEDKEELEELQKNKKRLEDFIAQNSMLINFFTKNPDISVKEKHKILGEAFDALIEKTQCHDIKSELRKLAVAISRAQKYPHGCF